LGQTSSAQNKDLLAERVLFSQFMAWLFIRLKKLHRPSANLKNLLKAGGIRINFGKAESMFQKKSYNIKNLKK
jgi:hypothetical protein